jgi:hypothetical protein
LLHLDHAQIPLGLIVVEWHLQIVRETQHFITLCMPWPYWTGALTSAGNGAVIHFAQAGHHLHSARGSPRLRGDGRKVENLALFEFLNAGLQFGEEFTNGVLPTRIEGGFWITERRALARSLNIGWSSIRRKLLKLS